MKNTLPRLLVILTVTTCAHIAFAAAGAVAGTDLYQLGPDSKPQEGVPKGEINPVQFVSSFLAMAGVEVVTPESKEYERRKGVVKSKT